MSSRSEQHLAKAAEFIAVAESGDAERSAYEHAAIEIEAALNAEPKLTQQQVAEGLGKSLSYVEKLLRAARSARRTGQKFDVDWGSGTNRRAEVVHKALERPEVLTEMIEQAPPAVRQKIIETITDQKTKTGYLISQEVRAQDAAIRHKRAEQIEQSRKDGAMPFPTYMAKMTIKIQEFSIGLAGLVDDLETLPEGRSKELLAQAVEGLLVQTQRWSDKLGSGRPELRLIEGQAKVMA